MKEEHRTIIVPKGKSLFITVPGIGDIGSLAGPAVIKIKSSKKRRRFDQDHLEEIKERVRNK